MPDHFPVTNVSIIPPGQAEEYVLHVEKSASETFIHDLSMADIELIYHSLEDFLLTMEED